MEEISSLLLTDTFVVALGRAAEIAKELCLPLWPSLLRSRKRRDIPLVPILVPGSSASCRLVAPLSLKLQNHSQVHIRL